METKTQDNERLQLLQTVEMFEAVTQANPDDFQSLEILKEAYVKLGRNDESHRIAKQIAHAHLNLGQAAKSAQEYEAIIKKWPDDVESKKALKELRDKQAENETNSEAAVSDAHAHAERPTGKDGDELLCDLIVKRANRLKKNLGDPGGDEVLCELIVKHNLLKEKDVMDVLQGVQAQNAQTNPDSIRMHLVQAFADRGLLATEQLLAFITEKTSLAFMPLTIYDVVPDTVRLLPRDLAFKHCIIPFDRISRTLLMASPNPFDEGAKKAIEKVIDFNLQWYACNPVEITQILKDVYLVGKASAKDD